MWIPNRNGITRSSTVTFDENVDTANAEIPEITPHPQAEGTPLASAAWDETLTPTSGLRTPEERYLEDQAPAETTEEDSTVTFQDLGNPDVTTT